MSLLLKRWRHKRSAAARRGREAHREYALRVAARQERLQGLARAASTEKQ